MSLTYKGKNNSFFSILVVPICFLMTIYVIRNWVVGLFEKVYPVTATVPNNSWLIQGALLAVIGLIYCVSWRRMVQQSSILSFRHIIFFTLFGLFLLFRFDKRLEFFHVPGWRLSYIGCCFLFTSLFEIALFLHRCYVSKHPAKQLHSDAHGFLYDAPSRIDSLKREVHAKTLVKQLISTMSEESVETSFCILLNEQFGAGKTSFFNQIKSASEDLGLRYLEFRPWLSDSSMAMTKDYLSLLENEIEGENPNISRMIKVYSGSLSGLQVGFLGLTFDRKEWTSSLTKKHDNISKAMGKVKQPLLVLVDDVDRLDTHELLSLLKLIRNTADFPYLCYILAADKGSLCQNLGLEGIVDTDLYLKKFFNLEINFPPDDIGIPEILKNRLSTLLRDFDAKESDIVLHIGLFQNVESLWDVLCTPRDINRYINLVTYSLELLRANGCLDEVNKLDVLFLSLVQFISPEWYKVLRDRNDKLLDYNTTRGRYFLNNNKIRAFYTESVNRIINDSLKHNINGLDSGDDTSDPTLKSVIQGAQMDPYNALKDVIYKMFGSISDYKEPDRICHKNEFFKYFSGHYRIGEFSSAEAFAYIKVPLGDFGSVLKGLSTKAQTESFLHKILLYVEEGECQDKVDLLKKLFLLTEKHFSFTRASAFELFKYSIEEQILFGLFLSNSAIDLPLSAPLREEKERFVGLVSKDNRFKLLSLMLTSLINQMNQSHFVYGDELPVNLREYLIQRFIQEKLNTSPFKKETLEIIPFLRMMSHVSWDEAFKQHVRSTNDPSAFIYNIVMLNNSGRIVWNQDYLHCFNEDGRIVGLKRFAINLVGDIFAPEVTADMDTLDVGGRDSNLVEANHPFIKAAMDWHRERMNKRKTHHR